MTSMNLKKRRLLKLFTPIVLLIGFQVSIPNAAHAAPAFSLSSSSETATVGTAITGYTITSLGTPITGYSIMPAPGNGISFDTSSGLLSGTPVAAHADITYTIGATDGANTVYQAFDLTVNAAVPTTPAFTLSSNLENAFVGTPIVGYTINSTGDLITHYAISPAPANGLTFNTTTGILSGTPTSVAAGNSYSIFAYDVGGNSAVQNYVLLVNVSTPTTPAFTLSQSSETVTVGSPITGYNINSTGDLILGYIVSPVLPPFPLTSNGLSFNPITGIISGTPTSTAAGAIYTITGADLAHNTASQTYTLTVNTASAPPITYYPKQQDSITSVRPTELQANTPTIVMISGNFPVPLTNVSINNVTLNSSNVVFQGGNNYAITIPAQPSGSTVELDFFDGESPLMSGVSLNVQAAATLPPPIIKVTSPVAPYILEGAVGVKFSEAIKATSTTYTGGVDPVTYSITSGSLPDGLKLNDDGTITGTPTSAGVSTLRASATDSTDPSVSGEVTFEIDISAPLTLTATQSGVVIPENKVIEVIGGQTVDPIKFTMNGAIGSANISLDPSSHLPYWISFFENSNTLFITDPNQINASDTSLSLTFIATDSADAPQTAKLTLNFEFIPSLSFGVTFRLGLITVIPGQNYTFNLGDDIQGGKAPITFAVTSGKLPAGFTLSKSGVLNGTFNGAGISTFTYTATDSADPSQTLTRIYYLAAEEPVDS